MASLETLPVELLDHILSFLPLPTLHITKAISKTLYQASLFRLRSLTSISQNFNNSQAFPTPSYLPWLQFCEKLRHLDLTGTSVTNYTGWHLPRLLQKFAPKLQSLETLVLDCLNTDTRHLLSDAAMAEKQAPERTGGFANLRRFSLKHFLFPGIAEGNLAVVWQSPKLEVVDISFSLLLYSTAVLVNEISVGPSRFSLRSFLISHLRLPRGAVQEKDLVKLGSRCPELRHLDLSNVMLFIDASLVMVSLASNVPLLQSLSFYGLFVPDEGLQIVGNTCTSLSFISLRGCAIFTLNGLLSFCRLRANSLHSIDLNEADPLSDHGAGKTVLAIVALLGDKLRSLSIGDLAWEENAMITLANQCPNLQAFYATGLKSITAATFNDFFAKLPHLRILNIVPDTLESNVEFLDSLLNAPCAPNLRALAMKFPISHPQDTLREIPSLLALRSLKLLTLHGLLSIGTETHLPESLEYLNLAGKFNKMLHSLQQQQQGDFLKEFEEGAAKEAEIERRWVKKECPRLRVYRGSVVIDGLLVEHPFLLPNLAVLPSIDLHQQLLS